VAPIAFPTERIPHSNARLDQPSCRLKSCTVFITSLFHCLESEQNWHQLMTTCFKHQNWQLLHSVGHAFFFKELNNVLLKDTVGSLWLDRDQQQHRLALSALKATGLLSCL